MTAPTTAPTVRRDGPDRRTIQIDRWPGESEPGPVVVLDRDGSEWVRSDLSRPLWYRTLADARRAAGVTNVARWVNAARVQRSADAVPDAVAFRRWVRAWLPVCPGVRRSGGWFTHDGCCDTATSCILPDGADLVDLYEAWKGSR